MPRSRIERSGNYATIRVQRAFFAKIKPVPPADQATLAKLVADLDSANFQKRALASDSLARIGEAPHAPWKHP